MQLVKQSAHQEISILVALVSTRLPLEMPILIQLETVPADPLEENAKVSY